jgi:ABC-type glycerol-3-phosphate transport system permease component
LGRPKDQEVQGIVLFRWINFWAYFLDVAARAVGSRDDSMLTLDAGLLKLDGEFVKQWGEMMAGYSIASLPLVVIFIFTMRLFVKGLASGAVKG